MKWGALLIFALMMPSALAFYPSSPSRLSIGFDYVLSYPPGTYFYVTTIYDNTTISIDTSQSGIFSTVAVANKGVNTAIDVAAPSSSIIHCTKPCLVSAHQNSDSWAYSLSPIQHLDREVTVAPDMTTVDVTPTRANTNLLIDKTNDGTWDTNVTMIVGSHYQYTTQIQAGSKLFANYPFVAIANDGDEFTLLTNTTFTNYYVPYPVFAVRVIAIYNGTNLSWDNNNDNSFDDSMILNNTNIKQFDTLNPGAYIKASKPVSVYSYGRFVSQVIGYSAVTVPGAKELGSEYYLPGYAPASGTQATYITAVYANTNVLVDKTLDGTWDLNTTLNPGVTYEFDTTYFAAGSRILANKPIFLTHSNYAGGIGSGRLGTYEGMEAGIALTSEINPSPADFGSLANVTGMIWNMHELVSNLSVTGSIPAGFIPYPSTGVLNLTVTKYFANATIANASSNFLISLTGSGPYTFQFSYADTPILSDLGDEQYITFAYRVTTPGAEGTYTFEPFSVSVGKATVWKFGWE